jgi:hypothetical protein
VSIKRENYDYLFWAKRPGSRQAVQLLARGAKEDRRLRDILDHLLATDGADLQARRCQGRNSTDEAGMERG